MKNILTILIIFLCISCQPTLRMITGIKKPKIENKETIKTFIFDNKIPIDTSELYYLSEEADYKKLAKFRDSLFRLPDVYLFNENGVFIDETMLCLSNRNRSNDNYDKNYYSEIFEADSLINRDKELLFLSSFIVNEDGINKPIKIKNGKTAVVLWSKFLGKKRTKKHIFNVTQDIKASSLAINVIYLNIDAMDFWK